MDSGTTAAIRKWQNWIIAAAIAAAVLVAYANSLRVPFLFDDIRSVARNSSLARWTTAFMPPANTSLSGRPVANATFALNHAMSGEAVWSYHALNVGIHLAAALLLFGLVRRTLLRLEASKAEWEASAFAGCTALLWAVHPLQTESVTYVVQRTESLVSLFYLLTLYAFVRGMSGQRRSVWLTISAAACALGMASKEVMVSAPLIVWLYDRTFVTRSFRGAILARKGYYAALAATWAVLAACVGAGPNRMLGGVIPTVSAWRYLLTQASAIPHYLRLGFWPAGQVFDYGYTPVAINGTVMVEFGAIAAAAVVSLWLIYRAREADIDPRPTRSETLGFAGCFFFAVLGPSSSVVPIPTESMAEHRIYLPLAAVLVIAMMALSRVFRRRAFIVAAVLAGCLAIATFARNEVLRSPVRLWSEVTTRRPENARGWANYGHALADAGRWREAIAACARQVQVDPRYTLDADAVTGRCLLELGEPAKALPHLIAAVRQNPDAFDIYNNVGMALAALDRPAEAAKAYEAALALDPNSALTHSNLANNLARANRAAEAWPHYAKAAALQPSDPQIQLNWGASLLEAGDAQGAIEHFNAALQADPRSAHAYLGIGNARAHLAERPPAIAAYRRAVELDPVSVAAHRNLAVMLMQEERREEAIEQLRAAVRLAPQSASLHRELALALAENNQPTEARLEAHAALRLDPQSAAAKQLLESVDRP